MKKIGYILMCLLAFFILGCNTDYDLFYNDLVDSYEDSGFETSDWTVLSHSKSADPDFEEVFNNSKVKRLDIVLTENRWAIMLANMTSLYGDFGGSGFGGMGGNSLVDSDENPVFVPAELYYEGKQWYRVGVRFKGNSSLQSSWKSGILKLSFKLDFDEFEDYYPQIENQRFYGFKKLSLKNNFDDNSCMREKVATEVFQRAGLAASHTAFYAVYVDHGDGPEYFGLYTLVEEIDDTVIDTQFSSGDGNLYKPEDSGASFINGTFSEADFEKKTNEEDGDWSDILTLFSVLHDDSRTEDPASWRAVLESIFDVDVFLKYLAVNTVIQNWDTYGLMTHNYYLYNNPDNDKLTWIPWDHNEALQLGKSGGALALNFSDIQKGGWPLIEYLYADEVYQAIYDAYVQKTVDEAFEIGEIKAIYDSYSSLIEPYVKDEVSGYTFVNSSSAFSSAVETLKNHVENRTEVANQYLN